MFRLKQKLKWLVSLPLLSGVFISAGSFAQADDSAMNVSSTEVMTTSINPMASQSATEQMTATGFLSTTTTPTPVPVEVPTEAPTFDYPASFPIRPEAIRQSSPFTLREKTNVTDTITADGLCLEIADDPVPARCRTASSAAPGLAPNQFVLNSMLALSVGIVTSGKTGDALSGMMAGAGTFFLSLLPGVFGQDEVLSGVAEGNARTWYTEFVNSQCETRQICQNKSFILERRSTWGQYGWLTLEGFTTTETTSPLCLTRNYVTNTLAIKDCAYRLEGGKSKVLDSQLWRFANFEYVREFKRPDGSRYQDTGPVINRIFNRADEQDECINLNTAESPSCHHYWVGTTFEVNGCTIYPDFRPGVCSTR